jgi:hypothetical protein
VTPINAFPVGVTVTPAGSTVTPVKISQQPVKIVSNIGLGGIQVMRRNILNLKFSFGCSEKFGFECDPVEYFTLEC